jgi:hypothetical protein
MSIFLVVYITSNEFFSSSKPLTKKDYFFTRIMPVIMPTGSEYGIELVLVFCLTVRLMSKHKHNPKIRSD